MNHPYDLLADLVDGSLDAHDRAQVDAHLATCASCREDLALATAGRDAARSLPQVAAPADLREGVVGAAGGRASRAPRWYRWAGAAAVAAAAVVAIAVALPDVGGGASPEMAAQDAGAEGAPGAASVTSAADVLLEVQDVNYGEDSLRQLAREAGTHEQAAYPTSSDAVQRDASAALGCVTQAFEAKPAGRLRRLIQARFDGRPAYLAVYLESPGAGQPPDSATVWVAAKADCTIVSFAQARL